MSTRNRVPLCKLCVWYSGDEEQRCIRSQNIITGKAKYCSQERFGFLDEDCGYEGKFYEDSTSVCMVKEPKSSASKGWEFDIMFGLFLVLNVGFSIWFMRESSWSVLSCLYAGVILLELFLFGVFGLIEVKESLK